MLVGACAYPNVFSAQRANLHQSPGARNSFRRRGFAQELPSLRGKDKVLSRSVPISTPSSFCPLLRRIFISLFPSLSTMSLTPYFADIIQARRIGNDDKWWPSRDHLSTFTPRALQRIRIKFFFLNFSKGSIFRQ